MGDPVCGTAEDDAQDNPALDDAHLQALRHGWLALDARGLDDAFDNDQFAPNLGEGR